MIKAIIDVHKKTKSIIFNLILLVNVLWSVIFFIHFLNTGNFDLSLLLYGTLFSTVLGYLVFILLFVGILLFSITPIRLQIFMKKPQIRKIPIILLFLVVTLSSLSYDYTLYDRATLIDITNFAWIIFGLNVTIFTFSYVFITNRLENKNKEDVEKNVETLFAKSNFNNEIHSRYATFTFIMLNAVILIISTFSILMLTSKDNVTKGNFILLLISFMLSTNTLILVLNDVSTEIQNKKRELMFEETFIKKENASILEIWKANKNLKEIVKNFKIIRDNATNDEIEILIDKFQVEPESIKFKNDKKAKQFVNLSLDFIKGSVEYLDLFNKMTEYSENLNMDDGELLNKILHVQKKIRGNQKRVDKIIRKLLKFSDK